MGPQERLTWRRCEYLPELMALRDFVDRLEMLF